MKTTFISFSFVLLSALSLNAQKLSTRTGYVKFFSKAPLENIEAVNNQVSSIIDLSNGSFAFLVPIKGFVFEKALMQEHFNENYMESGEYPKASFQGTIDNFEEINLNDDGEFTTTMTGIMNIHGVDQKISEKATFSVKEGRVSLNSKFYLKPADYKIEIPTSKKDNIAETLEITVKMDYEKK